MLLSFRQKYSHGLSAAYYRDHVRRRILSTAPVRCAAESACEIHVLTSDSDWLNLVWALKSFYLYSRRSYALCIHDDGSLGETASTALRTHFPDARLVPRTQADREVPNALKSYPRCLRLRESHHLSPKLFDFGYYLKAPRMLLLDSDILFFSEPVELLRRIEDASYHLNSVNADVESAYTVDPQQVKSLIGLEIPERFNSGLGLIHADSLRFDWIEDFLTLPDVESHFWRIEQTIFALCSSRFGVELLPEEYAVRFGAGLGSGPCRHYVGPIRQLMYKEGVRHLVRSGFLRP